MSTFTKIILSIIISIHVIECQRIYVPPPEQPTAAERQFRVVYEWQTIAFTYRNEIEQANAIYANQYIPQNNLIADVKAFANRLYLTIPRMKPGVPATLGWIITPENNGPTNPQLEPYPSWEMNEIGNCSAFQFVQGIAIDADGIMWVADTGRVNTLDRGIRQPTLCSPKIVLLDLKRNGTVILRYEFPEDVASREFNYLNKIVVDDAFGGFAYITDNSGRDPGIVVYSRRLNRSWKIREDNSMRAAQNAQEFAVNGTGVNFAIHIDGIALGPYYNPNTGATISPNGVNGPFTYNLKNENYERNVFYCPLSSYHLYSLPASLLRDPEFARRSSPRDVLEAVVDWGVKNSQTDGMIMDNNGILYFGLLREHAVAQWDSYKPFTIQNQMIIGRDDTYIQWTDGMSIDEQGQLFIVVNRLHNFVTNGIRTNEVNFRILKSKVGSLSYVHTSNMLGFGPSDQDNILNRGITLNDVFSNGISSSTPVFSSLESQTRNYYYGNSAEMVGLNYYFFILVVSFLLLSLNFN